MGRPGAADDVSHRIRCRCGKVSGAVAEPHTAIRAVCHCVDCRAYAVHLGSERAALDAEGGTDIVATQARHVTFDAGAGQLACVSLSPKGLLRWYAACCNTPIANTPRDWRFAYVGLVHTALATPLEASFPRVQMHVNASHLASKPPSRGWRGTAALLGLMRRLVGSRLTGRYRTTQLFTTAGKPVVDVSVLSREERERATRAAAGASGDYRR